MKNFQTASELKRPSENLFNNRGDGNSQSKGFYNHLNIGYTRQTLFFLLSLDHHHFLHYSFYCPQQSHCKHCELPSSYDNLYHLYAMDFDRLLL